MEAIDFIKKELSKFVEKFPTIKCSYVFDTYSISHLVLVEQNKICNEKEEMLNEEIEIIFSFIDKFEDETLTFIYEDNEINFNNPLLTIIGDLYKEHITNNIENLSIKIPKNNNLQFSCYNYDNLENLNINSLPDNKNIDEALFKFDLETEFELLAA